MHELYKLDVVIPSVHIRLVASLSFSAFLSFPDFLSLQTQFAWQTTNNVSHYYA